MSKIIDFYTGLPLKKDHKSYQERFQACYDRKMETGKCDCHICKEKKRMAARMIKFGKQQMVDFMKKEEERMYYSDLLEVFVMSAKTLHKYLNKDKNGKI